MQKWHCTGKTYKFKPWTLAYAGTDPTAKPRTHVHATHSQALLSIYPSCAIRTPPPGGCDPPRGRTYSGRHWTVFRSRGSAVTRILTGTWCHRHMVQRLALSRISWIYWSYHKANIYVDVVVKLLLARDYIFSPLSMNLNFSKLASLSNLAWI